MATAMRTRTAPPSRRGRQLRGDALHAPSPASRDRDEVLPAHRVRHHAAVNAAPGLKTPAERASARVERENLTSAPSSDYEAERDWEVIHAAPIRVRPVVSSLYKAAKADHVELHSQT